MSERQKVQKPERSRVTVNGRRLPKDEAEPDWTQSCEACGSRPILPATGLCGPCTFGEADTAGGNWDD